MLRRGLVLDLSVAFGMPQNTSMAGIQCLSDAMDSADMSSQVSELLADTSGGTVSKERMNENFFHDDDDSDDHDHHERDTRY